MHKLVNAFALRMLLGVFCVPLVGAAGCHVHTHGRHDNGLHRGHHKNNPGKKKGHSKRNKNKKNKKHKKAKKPNRASNSGKSNRNRR
jgi:hypothetical protein